MMTLAQLVPSWVEEGEGERGRGERGGAIVRRKRERGRGVVPSWVEEGEGWCHHVEEEGEGWCHHG